MMLAVVAVVAAGEHQGMSQAELAVVAIGFLLVGFSGAIGRSWKRRKWRKWLDILRPMV